MGPTLPPETTATRVDPAIRRGPEDGCDGGRAGRLAGELRVGVEPAHRVLDLVVGDDDRPRRRPPGRPRALRRPRTARRARSRSSRGASADRRAGARARGRSAARALGLDPDDAHAPRGDRGAIPTTSPPPPTGTAITSDLGTVLEDLEPDRALPGHTRGSSNGCTSTLPVSARCPSRRTKASEGSSASTSIIAPSARARSSLNRLASGQENTTQSSPSAAAPQASAIAWLPADAPATPRVAFLGAERREPVDDAARLERARVLEQLRLEHEPRDERRAVERRRPADAAADRLGGPDDVLARHGSPVTRRS